MTRTLQDRLARIARHWHARFRLPEDRYSDVYQSAWELWLSYTHIENPEYRIAEVWKRLYYVILREKYGRLPKHDGNKPLPPSPVFVDLDANVTCETDYVNRVLLREIADAVKRKAGQNNKRPQAIKQIIDGKATRQTIERMRRYLRQEGLAA